MALQCEPFQLTDQRRFWTTKIDACGESPSSCDINVSCGRPGLAAVTTDDGMTFETDDWVRSLAYNMLLTDARRRDTRCGYAPGTLNGHWSESFMQQGKPVGTYVRYVTASTSVRDAVLLVKAEVQATLQKLVDYKIAVEVVVNAEYQGSGAIAVSIEIFGTAVDPTRIALTAQRNENSWAWVA